MSDLLKRLEIHKQIQGRIISAFMNCFLKRLFVYRNAKIFYKIKRDKTSDKTKYLMNQLDDRLEKIVDYLYKCGIDSIELKIEFGDIKEKEITQRKMNQLKYKKRGKIFNKNKIYGARA